jgi:hypothetical protein
MAPGLDPLLTTPCADTFGNPLTNGTYQALQKMQLDHVPGANESAMGKRAASDKEHLITICPSHHLHGWATSKRGRAFEREYLASLYGH